MYSILSPYSPLIYPAEVFLAGLVISSVLYFTIHWILHASGAESWLSRWLGKTTKIAGDTLPRAISKYFAVFVFLLFLRKAVEVAGYMEIEQFLSEVVAYLPHLFLALLIVFFGMQSSQTSYNLVYKALKFEDTRTALILAQAARIIILFFTFTIAIDQINTESLTLIPDYLIQSLFIGFIGAMSLACGLAFGLGGKDSAAQLIREYLEKKSDKTK